MIKYNFLFIHLFSFLLFTNTIVFAQDSNWDYEERNIISLYWTTLSQEEKKIYLFSYMTQVYETYDALKKEVGYEKITQWYYDNKAETVFGIFDQLEDINIVEYIGWIDEWMLNGWRLLLGWMELNIWILVRWVLKICCTMYYHHHYH